MNTDTGNIEAGQLFTFIREFARLSHKPVESLDSYIKTFWLDQIPHESECSFIAWAGIGKDEEETAIENWLEVERPERPDPPPVAEELMPWVNVLQWQNSTIEVPELLAKILNPSWSEDNPEADPQFLELGDYAQLQNAWDDYVETEWWPWAEKDRRKEQVQECYNELFSMHRTQVATGEQYEFFLAVGCLHWDTPSSGKAKRHLLVLPVTIEFDSVNAVVAVQSAGSTPEAQLETDMLVVHDRPPTDIEEDAETRRNLLGDNLFHSDAKTLLKAYVQGLDSEGVFIDAIDRVTGTPPPKPEVTFAPALIVRRRTSRSLISACESIISQLQECDGIPAGVRKLVGELGVDESIFREESKERDADDGTDREVYFPLAYNDEQAKILGTLERQIGVLVQGPPGTGKSQTIANLICHLLATGKRILVTSHKAPALRVLKGLLPPEVADLCVMILGEGADEQQELRRSVAEVANRHTNWSAHQSQRQIEKLRTQLASTRGAQAKAFEKLCAIREQETFKHPVLFGGYEGTLSEIARHVHRDSDKFIWFRDRLPGSISVIDKPPLALPVEQPIVERLLCLLRQIEPKEETRTRAHLLSLSNIPSVDQFRTMVHAEKKANTIFEEQKQCLDHPDHDALSGVSTPELSEMLNTLDEFHGRLRGVKNSDTDWEWHTTEEILHGNIASFEALQTTSGELLDHIQREARQIADIEVAGLGDRSHRAILQDAQELKSHFESGGRCGFWVFRPAAVKQGLYLTREVKVDGRVCGSPDPLGRLIRWLQLNESIVKLGEQWAVLTAVNTSNLPLNQAIGRYKQLQSRLDNALVLGEIAEALNRQLDAYDRSILRSWYDLEAVSQLRGLVAVLIAQRDLLDARKVITEAETDIHDVCLKPQSAPENHRLRNAIQHRLIDEYVRSHDELTSLWECRRACEEKNHLLTEVTKELPELAKSLSASFSDDVWDSRINSLQDAWNWLCTDSWLSQMADPLLEDSLNQQVKQARHDASLALSQLAAEKAWQHCMGAMTEGSLQSLRAWRKVIERLGKGTGKYAERDRLLAKEHLEECRDAIPAWVMPFYKVLDTVTVRPGVFDVAIIDEASQSGPDALILAFLAKQIVVVGDDQQIRPENVGIDYTEVHQLQQHYLRNIPKADIFGATESLFSIAEVRFGNPIRLREHFRCMPEIIAFSNRLCYQDQPLIPLRQFGRDRLTPILHTYYVSGGYQEKRKVNPVEADAVVSAIERCCGNPAYAGKTFGVISLLHSSDQDREIESRLISRLDAEEIEQRNIVCGDAYDFQGDERDVIFLSMVTARSDQGRIHTMSGEKAKRRFNVAVSRACDQVQLFHSVQEGELGQNCLRRRLLLHMKQPPVDPTAQLRWTIEELQQLSRNTPRTRGNQPHPFDSWFEADVFLAIAGLGYSAIPQYEVHGYYIDIVIVGGTRKVAVECDGDEWHGPQQYANDLHRQNQLKRCKWEFFRVRGSHFYRDPDSALLPLWEMLETHDKVDDSDKAPPQKSEDRVGDRESTGASHAEAKKQMRSPRKAKSKSSTDKKHTPTISSLDQVLSMPNRELGKVICEILEACPNYTSKKDDLPKRVCKYFNFITRGSRLNQLKKKIGWAMTSLKKAGKIEEYKAKNIRIRLLHPNEQGKLL